MFKIPEAKNTPNATRITPSIFAEVIVSFNSITPPINVSVGVNASVNVRVGVRIKGSSSNTESLSVSVTAKVS